MPVDPLQIGLKIQALRKTKNLTQEQLSEGVGVSWRTISNLETGKVIPKLLLIYDLAQYFDVSIDELVNNNVKKVKSRTRLQQETQVIETIQALDDNTLLYIKEYILLLKQHFPEKI